MKNFARLLFFFAIAGLMTACKGGPEGEKATTGDEVKTDTKEVDNNENATYTVNEGGTLSWEGTKVIGGGHKGTINVKGGSVTVEGGKLSGGIIEVDMASLANLDLEGEKKGKLEGHLKSGDFFDVENHPTCKFEVTSAERLKDDEKNANYIIAGNLTIKGVTKNIAFKANVNNEGDNVTVSSPPFVIDRTDWNVQYGSGKFFADLAKDKVISDNIGLSLNVTLSKK